MSIDEDKIIADALILQQKLERRAQFEMLRMGHRDTATALQDPRAQEMLGRSALAQAIQANLPAEKPKGSARSEAPKISARKRQRQARKGNR